MRFLLCGVLHPLGALLGPMESLLSGQPHLSTHVADTLQQDCIPLWLLQQLITVSTAEQILCALHFQP